jgi:hypothetical protein
MSAGYVGVWQVSSLEDGAMRSIKLLGLSGLVGCLILNALLASEPAGFNPSDDATKPATDRPVGDVLLDARLRRVEQGLAKQAPAIQPQEALLLLAALRTRVEQVLAKGKDHPAFAKEEPTTLDEFEKRFWSTHVLGNQLSNAARFIDYAPGLQSTAKKYKPKTSDATDLSVLQADWSQLKTDLSDLRNKLTRRDRNLRVARLKLSDQVLTGSKDIEERFLAALAVDVDADTLQQALVKDPTFRSELGAKINTTLKHAQATAGQDLLQKSRLLFTGLNWWVRGRYGLGTTGGGLLKDPSALLSSEAMFGLLMPIEQPEPTPPNSTIAVPAAQRRHHYLWQLETRQFGQSSKTSDVSTSRGGGEVAITTNYFY